MSLCVEWKAGWSFGVLAKQEEFAPQTSDVEFLVEIWLGNNWPI
jgi:hypothetical protein